MSHRAGGKLVDAHTTVIDAVAMLIDFLVKDDEVDKIGLEAIVPVRNRRISRWVFKILREDSGLLVKVTQKISKQEIRVYTSCSNRQAVMERLTRHVLNAGHQVRFKDLVD